MSSDDNQMNRRRLLQYAGAATAAAVAGCAGDGGDGGDDEPTDGETGTTGEMETTQGGSGSFGVGVTMGQMDSGLDPQDHAETNTDIIVSQAYEGLMGREKDGAIRAALATEWERVEPGTVRFTLRDGVTFHNGDPLTAEDVRYSIRRIVFGDVGIESPQANDLGVVSEVRTGDGEVTVDFDGLNPIAFALFATNGQVMQQSWVEDNSRDFINRNMNGTGPFQLRSYDSGNEVVVEAYEDYWGDAPTVDTVTLNASSESSTRVNRLLAEESDIVTNVPPQEVSRVNGSDVASVSPVPSTRVIFLTMRNDVEPFSNQTFRQALNYAVDNAGIVENVLNDFGTVSTQPTLPGFTGHNPDLEPYAQDQDRAERLIEESGFAGESITLQTPIGRYLKDVEVAQAAANQMDSLSNLSCELQQREFSALVQDITTGDIEDKPPFTLLGWGNGEFDAVQTIIPLMASNGSLTFFKNEEVDQQIQAAQNEADPEAREQLLRELNADLRERAPWVFLHRQFSVYGVSDDISWEPRSDELIDPVTATRN
jgi:peptide/nickel transport system substrate-binding protein